MIICANTTQLSRNTWVCEHTQFTRVLIWYSLQSWFWRNRYLPQNGYWMLFVSLVIMICVPAHICFFKLAHIYCSCFEIKQICFSSDMNLYTMSRPTCYTSPGVFSKLCGDICKNIFLCKFYLYLRVINSAAIFNSNYCECKLPPRVVISARSFNIFLMSSGSFRCQGPV